MQKIIPNLWFDTQAKEAAEFYLSVFENGTINTTTYYGKSAAQVSGQPEGSVLTVEFEIEGFSFIGINGGPAFTMTPALSFFAFCRSEEEVTRRYEMLAEGGKVLMPLDTYPFSKKYGWVEDQYGVSWQLILDEEGSKQRIIPSLLFVGSQYGRAYEAMQLYTSLFEDSSIGDIAFYRDMPVPNENPEAIAYGPFTLAGIEFVAMDSGMKEHQFTFSVATSLMVNADDQEEIDRLWAALSAEPEAEQCGWLKDTFGVSWQIVSKDMQEMLSGSDSEAVERAMAAMLQMKKIDIATLRRAYEG